MRKIILFALMIALLSVIVYAQQEKMVAEPTVSGMPPLDPYAFCCRQYADGSAGYDYGCCDSSSDVSACYECVVDMEGPVHPAYPRRTRGYSFDIRLEDMSEFCLFLLVFIFPLSFLIWVIDGILKLATSKGFLPNWVKIALLSINFFLGFIALVLSGWDIAILFYFGIFLISGLVLLSDWITRLANKKGYLGNPVRIGIWLVFAVCVFIALFVLMVVLIPNIF